MEWHIDTRKRDSCEASLKFDVPFGLLLLLGLIKAARNYVLQHLLDLLDSELLGELYTMSKTK
jgi:hypothetical protein